MATPTSATSEDAWTLVRRQHGVITRGQLLALGYTAEAIRHRLRTGRLHVRARGVYAAGRPALTWYGELMVAVLATACGAVISHETAALLWGLLGRRGALVHVTCPRERSRARSGVRVHCRSVLGGEDVTSVRRVPVTSPARTLVDIAPTLSAASLERAVNVADSLDLIDPQSLRTECRRFAGQPGVKKLRGVLDRRTFRATDSRLEQRLLSIARRTTLSLPETQRYENGFRVDFVWRDIGLVVEVDSLRYHRTPAQQYRDARRDQAHFAAGRERVRFTHAQVFFEDDYVEETLEAAARRLGAA